MTKKEKEQMIEAVRSVFSDETYSPEIRIDIWQNQNIVNVEVSRMYEFLPLTFAHLKKLAVIFGTERFAVDQDSYKGCETCDYGSKYTHTFTFQRD